MSWGGYSSWSKTLVRGPFLVTPVRLLWQSYKDHCELWGFDQSDATEFVHWLRGEECVELKNGGRGRVRQMAIGVTSTVSAEGYDAQSRSKKQSTQGLNP